MRRRLPFVTVGLFAAILSIIIGVYAAATYQTVRFDTLLVDSGLVREGQQVRARFRFRNDGRSGAAILNLAPTCGVRAALVRGRTVASGEDGALEIRIDTSGRQGPVTGGVAVTLRDPFQRVVVLTVKTIVDPEFVVGTPIV